MAVNLHLEVANPVGLQEILEVGEHNLNAVNEEGETVLRTAINQDNFESVVVLLAHGASPNLIHQPTRNRPLHIAATVGNVQIIKALLVFGASVDERNGRHETARHIVSTKITWRECTSALAAVGAGRCQNGMRDCRISCRYHPNEAAEVPEENGPIDAVTQALQNLLHLKIAQQDNPRGGLLLSLDGGGIRGLVMIQILLYLENILKRISGNDATISSYVSYYAGTSTGGILALAMATGRPLLEIRKLYLSFKNSIFKGWWPFPIERLENFLRQQFGEGAMRTVGNGDNRKVMIMATLVENTKPQLAIFRNFDSPEVVLGEEVDPKLDPDQARIFEAAKYTATAPFFFTVDNRQFIDGGLKANNPTMSALTELTRLKAAFVQTGAATASSKFPGMVISLGCGISQAGEATAMSFDASFPTTLEEAYNRLFDVPRVLSVLASEMTNANLDVVKDAEAECSERGIKYWRITPPLAESVGLTETNNGTLVQMLFETEAFLYGKREQLQIICQSMIENGVHQIEENHHHP